jgi:hypothetical protein
MVWVVSIDSRFQEGRSVFFMKQPNPTNQWWTVVLEKTAIFKDRDDAQRLVNKLKYNNPKVISLQAAHEAVANWNVVDYTVAGKKNNYDRQISPLVLNRNRPSIRQTRAAQYDLFEPEYEHELDHLFGLDGWGSEGR